MPFTTFHFGPGAAVSLPLRKHIDVPAFILVNVAVDIEPLLVLALNLNYPVHGYLHTFLIGSTVALAFSLIAYAGRNALRIVMDNVYFPYDTSFGKILFSSLLGVWFHVLLDALLYTDIRPFYPLKANPLYGTVPSDAVYLICTVSFVPALFLGRSIILGEFRLRADGKVPARIKVVSSTLWTLCVIGACAMSLFIALRHFVLASN